MLGELSVPADGGAQLHREVCSVKARVLEASNRSVKDGTAGHAYVLEGTKSSGRIEEAGPADWDPDYMHSFHGELVGVLVQAYVLLKLVDFYGNPEEDAEVDFHFDNKEVNKRAAAVIKGRGLKGYLGHEYDILAKIRRVVAALQASGVRITFVWVRGASG